MSVLESIHKLGKSTAGLLILKKRILLDTYISKGAYNERSVMDRQYTLGVCVLVLIISVKRKGSHNLNCVALGMTTTLQPSWFPWEAQVCSESASQWIWKKCLNKDWTKWKQLCCLYRWTNVCITDHYFFLWALMS